MINGQKIWTSRFHQSDYYLLLARTTPYEEVQKKTDGLSLFLVDIKEAGAALQPRPIDTMLNHHTNVSGDQKPHLSGCETALLSSGVEVALLPSGGEAIVSR